MIYPRTISPSATTWSPQALIEPPSTVMPSRLTFKFRMQRFPPSSSVWEESNCSSNLSNVKVFLSFPILTFRVILAVFCGIR